MKNKFKKLAIVTSCSFALALGLVRVNAEEGAEAPAPEPISNPAPVEQGDPWGDWAKQEAAKVAEKVKKETAEKNKPVANYADGVEGDPWGDWAKQEAAKVAEKEKKEKLAKTTKPEDASTRVELKPQTSNEVKNEKLWADQAEELYRANRIEELAKFLNNKLAAKKKYQEALKEYKRSLENDDHWDAAVKKATVLDVLRKEYPNVEYFKDEDFASDYLELTASANTKNPRGDVAEVNKNGKTDTTKVTEEGSSTTTTTTPDTKKSETTTVTKGNSVTKHNPNWKQDLKKHNEFVKNSTQKTLPNAGYVSNNSILLASGLLTALAIKVYKKQD